MIAAVVRDLMLFSRIEAAAGAAGVDLLRVDDPEQLPTASDVALAIVDWAERGPSWPARLTAWRDAAPDRRVILFGRHTDLEAHHAARDAGLGPMWARSRLVAELPSLIRRVGAGPATR